MFTRHELLRLKPLFIFFAAFTILFVLFTLTLKYTFPFLAGFLLALCAQPIIVWLRDRLKFRPAAAAAVATLAVYAVLFGILFLLGYWLILELSNLVTYISSLSKADIGALTAPINGLIRQLGESLKNIDSSFIEQNQEKMLSLAQNGIGIAGKIFSTVLRFLTSLPAIFTMFIVMVFSTYFFSKDMPAIKEYLFSQFPRRTIKSLKAYSKDGRNMGGRYIGSYLLIYFITFLETLVVFAVLRVPYPLMLSIITGVADILPVLGPGTIYIPLAFFSLVTGNPFRAGALLVCWLLITAIRQIIEPKIVSSSINIHPLSMLAAIYFALVSGNFWVLIYIPALLVLYQVLTRDGILPTLIDHTLKDGDSGP